MPHASHLPHLIARQHEKHPCPMDDPGDHQPAVHKPRFNAGRTNRQLAKGAQPVPSLQRPQIRHTADCPFLQSILRFATRHLLKCQSHRQPVAAPHLLPDIPALPRKGEPIQGTSGQHIRVCDPNRQTPPECPTNALPVTREPPPYRRALATIKHARTRCSHFQEGHEQGVGGARCTRAGQ